MYQILIREIGNKDAEWKQYMHNLTHEEAVKECEEWGWFYDDGKKSYTMFIQEIYYIYWYDARQNKFGCFGAEFVPNPNYLKPNTRGSSFPYILKNEEGDYRMFFERKEIEEKVHLGRVPDRLTKYLCYVYYSETEDTNKAIEAIVGYIEEGVKPILTRVLNMGERIKKLNRFKEENLEEKKKD